MMNNRFATTIWLLLLLAPTNYALPFFHREKYSTTLDNRDGGFLSSIFEIKSNIHLIEKEENLETALLSHLDTNVGICDVNIREFESANLKASTKLVDMDKYRLIPGVFNPVPMMIGNPSGHYMTAVFPPIGHPPGFCSALNYNNWLTCMTGYHLGPRDAIVIPFCTPPKADYFSINTYVTVRRGVDPRLESDESMRDMPRFVAAELGDASNHLILNTSASGEDSVFSQRSLFISTADEETASDISNSFIEAGWPESAIHVHVLPSEKLRFADMRSFVKWRKNFPDGFGTLLRMSNYDDDAPNAKLYKRIRWPIYLVQSTKNEGLVAMEPEPPRKRITGESDYNKYDKAIKELANIIRRKLSKTKDPVPAIKFNMTHVVPDADACLRDPNYKPLLPPLATYGISGVSTCDWLTTDGLYTFSANESHFHDMHLHKDEVIVAIGVNHQAIGRTTSSSLMMTSLFAFELHLKTLQVTDHDYPGSAAHMAPELEHGEDLFVHAFARSCPPEFSKWCTEVPYYKILPNEPVFFVERKYLNPKTLVGLAAEETIPPMLMKLKIGDIMQA